MKHVFAHFHDGTFCTLLHSIVLRSMLNDIFHSKNSNSSKIEFPPIINQNSLILCSGCFSKMPWTPWTSQSILHYTLTYIYPHIPWKIINKGHKILCPVYICDFHGHKYKSAQFSKASLLASPHCWQMLPDVPYMLHKSMKTWKEKFCYSPCFRVHRCSSHSNIWANNATTIAYHILLAIIPSWPHLPHIPYWR